MLIEKLNECTSFNNTEQHIAEYFFQHMNELDCLTLNKIAVDTYTSNTTILRFCKKLGYHGFKSFKYALFKEISAFHSQPVNVNRPFTCDSQLSDICKNLAELSEQVITDTYLNIDLSQLTKALALLQEADRIFVYAKSNSYISALNFASNMLKLNKYVILAEQMYEGTIHLMNITEKDIVIFLTYRGHHSDYSRYAIYLKEKNIHSIMITSAKSGLLQNLVSVLLLVPERESVSEKIAPFASQISFGYVLNILYSYFFMLDYDGNYERTTNKNRCVRKMLDNS